MDLSLIPLESLIKEVMARHDNTLIVTENVLRKASGEHRLIEITPRYQGDYLKLAGMCGYAQRKLLKEYDSTERPIAGG